MSWLSPTRWLLIGGLILALTLGYFAWADHIGDKREAQVLAKLEKLRAAENAKNAQITAKWQKGKDDALIDANKRAQVAKVAADKLAAVNRGLRDELTDQRGKLSTASIDAARQYAAAANSVFAECSREVERLAGEASGHSSDSLMYQSSWPK
jgi:hypothetical protein